MRYPVCIFFSSDPSCFSYYVFPSVLYVWWSGNPLITPERTYKIFFPTVLFVIHKFCSNYISLSILWAYLRKCACCQQNTHIFCCVLIAVQDLDITEHKDSLGIHSVQYNLNWFYFFLYSRNTLKLHPKSELTHWNKESFPYFFHTHICTDFMQQLLCKEITKKKRN